MLPRWLRALALLLPAGPRSLTRPRLGLHHQPPPSLSPSTISRSPVPVSSGHVPNPGQSQPAARGLPMRPSSAGAACSRCPVLPALPWHLNWEGSGIGVMDVLCLCSTQHGRVLVQRVAPACNGDGVVIVIW